LFIYMQLAYVLLAVVLLALAAAMILTIPQCHRARIRPAQVRRKIPK